MAEIRLLRPRMNVVLTGSSSGIGRALAERLLMHGHAVWGLARTDQSALQQQHSTNFRFTRCDVADWSQVAAAAADVGREWPSLDALVTCAGIQGAVGRTVTLQPDEWAATVRSNLEGTFFPLRAFWPLLSHASRRTKVVCFSGGGATKARPNFSAYACAKSAVVRLVENIAAEETSAAVDINAIAPGAINTRMTEEVIAKGPTLAGESEYRAALAQKASGGGSIDRALDLVEWLLSPASDGISGRLLSAPWDPWPALDAVRDELARSDIYTLRRITPEDRGQKWTQ